MSVVVRSGDWWAFDAHVWQKSAVERRDVAAPALVFEMDPATDTGRGRCLRRKNKWAQWAIDLGAKQRNRIVKAYRLSVAECKSFRKACRLERHRLAQARHVAKKRRTTRNSVQAGGVRG